MHMCYILCLCTHYIIIVELVTSNSSSSKLVSEIHSQAQAVAEEVQGVCISESLTPQTTNLVVTSVINQTLHSLVNAFTHLDSFFNQPLSKELPRCFK